MILIPKAKPIRIRIISGGEEHSSLESLRNNFSLKDLIPTVKDGRLAKWLRQKGENELAERILNFSFNSDSSKSDRNNALEFIGIFFPNLKALSVGGVIDFWRKENKKNFQHLIEFFKYSPTLDEVIKWYREGNKTTSEREKWRSLFIDSLRKVGLKTAIDKYIEGSLNELLSDDDWSKVFSNRRDYTDATMFYEVGRNLANIPKYRDIALEYLKKSAALGFLNAKQYLRDEMKVGEAGEKIEKEENKVWKEEDKVEKDKIDIFLKNPLLFKNTERRGSDLDHFLKVLAVSLANDGRSSLTNTIRLNNNRTYYKYIEIVEILRRYYTSFNARKYPAEIIRALWDLGRVNFPASIRVYKDFSENTMKFRDFRYEDLIKYVVELVKEYEFK